MYLLSRLQLRSFLIVVALSSIGFAWYAANSQRRNADILAIEKLESLSEYGYIAKLHDDESLYCGTGVSGIVEIRSSVPQWLHKPLVYCKCDILYRAEEVSLWGRNFDDRVIGPLTEMSFLRRVSLEGTKVTESGARRLKVALPNTVVEYTPPSP